MTVFIFLMIEIAKKGKEDPQHPAKWLIKNWNLRSQTCTYNINRALYWFQPIELTSKEVQKQIASYAQETGIERHSRL